MYRKLNESDCDLDSVTYYVGVIVQRQKKNTRINRKSDSVRPSASGRVIGILKYESMLHHVECYTLNLSQASRDQTPSLRAVSAPSDSSQIVP